MAESKTSTIEQLRASDFVILKGEKDGKPYKFAKIDSRCSLMNNEQFLNDLESEGTKVVTIGAKQ